MANAEPKYHRSLADDKVLHRSKVEKEKQLIAATGVLQKK